MIIYLDNWFIPAPQILVDDIIHYLKNDLGLTINYNKSSLSSSVCLYRL